MNPLILINNAGYTQGIQESSHDSFQAKVEYLHNHFVVKGEWIDPKNGSCIPKSIKLTRIIQNIIDYVKYLLNLKIENKFSGIKNALCQYIIKNLTHIGVEGADEQTTKDSIIKNKELILKLNDISVMIGRKSIRCFQKINCHAEILAGANPMVDLSSYLASLLNMNTSGEGIHVIFEKLGLKNDIPRIMC